MSSSITDVTVSLGANDLFYTLATKGSFDDALKAYQTDALTLLGEIRASLPTAKLVLLGYYDPFAPFLNDSKSSFPDTAVAASQAIPALKAIIRADAQAFGGYHADTCPAFQGLELTDTYITAGNVHPTPDGYGLIAAAVESVPGPASVVLVACGLGTVVLAGRRRQARTPARA